MPTRTAAVAGALELALAGLGIVLLWRIVLSPQARTRYAGARLTPWSASIAEIFIFIGYILAGTLMLGALGNILAGQFGLKGDARTIVAGAASQLGMLGGVLLYWAQPERGRPTSPPNPPSVFLTGATTFLVCLPLLIITAKLWEWLLLGLGLPVAKQDLVGMFLNADSPWLISVMVALAVLIAPIAEELVFRAGIFRFLRSRVPRWVALFAPALVFAALHVNWVTLQGLSSLAPLVVLAVLFSLAYERTGQIGTSMVAHGLFNLNTVILLFAGAGT